MGSHSVAMLTPRGMESHSALSGELNTNGHTAIFAGLSSPRGGYYDLFEVPIVEEFLQFSLFVFRESAHIELLELVIAVLLDLDERELVLDSVVRCLAKTHVWIGGIRRKLLSSNLYVPNVHSGLLAA